MHRFAVMQVVFAVPGDFDQMGKDDIIHLFQAASIATRGY
jgi:hypothetical protein